MQTYDLVVLGAGSGGIATAIRAARHGARVAVLEPNALGGTCVNVGCVPKKAMWLAAELAEAQAIAREVGFASEPGALDWVEFVRHRQAYIDAIHASYRRRFDEFGIELVPEYGRFAAPMRIATPTRELEAKHVVVATGARPRRLSIPGGDLGIVSDGFFDLRATPRRVAIVGGGYIAVELAGVLRALRAEASIFMRGDALLGGFDREVTDELAHAMELRGVRIARRREPDAASEQGGEFALHFGDEREGGFDALIWAIGRDPNTESLALDRAGVLRGASGHIEADDRQNTSVVGVYALGDVTGRLALTPVAVAAGRRLADRLFGGKADAKVDYADVPTVVFAHPPLGSVGLSEENARRLYGDERVAVYRTRFRPMLDALRDGAERTFMKLVCVGEDERVVGIHMLGRSADEILQGFAVALKAGACKRDFDETVAIHPTSAEELVLMGEMNRAPVI